MNYPMYGNNQMYMQDLQNMRDRIDQQMRQMQQQSMQPMQNQPANITQNFQLAPNQSNTDIDAKYAKDIDEVKNTLALKNTIFVDKDMKLLWIKSINGEIKTYSLTEVIELDPKDKEILELKKQIEEMKNMVISQNKPNEQIMENKIDKKSNKEELKK